MKPEDTEHDYFNDQPRSFDCRVNVLSNSPPPSPPPHVSNRSHQELEANGRSANMAALHSRQNEAWHVIINIFGLHQSHKEAFLDLGEA